jgi:hypothetical protein
MLTDLQANDIMEKKAREEIFAKEGYLRFYLYVFDNFKN